MAVFKKIENGSENERVEPTTFGSDSSVVSGGKKSVIGKTLSLKGELFSDEDVLVEGKVNGKLTVKKRVTIGKGGVADADIDAREVLIIGKVNGNVKASYKIEIVPEGTLNGNIVAQRVVLAEGALFKGSVDMIIDGK